MDINWGAAKLPDFFGTYTNALQLGHEVGKQRATDAALRSGDLNALAAVDPERAAKLTEIRKTQQDRQWGDQAAAAYAGGDVQGARTAIAHTGDLGSLVGLDQHIAGLSAAQRAQAADANQKVAAVLHGIQGASQDPAERLRMAQHVVTQHPEFGIQPESLTMEDVTDQGIASHVASAMTVQEMLAQSKPVSVAPGASLVDPTHPAHPLYTAPIKMPFGWRINPQTNAAEPDPAYLTGVGQIAGVRRDAIVERPMPKAAGHGGGGSSYLPLGAKVVGMGNVD